MIIIDCSFIELTFTWVFLCQYYVHVSYVKFTFTCDACYYIVFTFTSVFPCQDYIHV